MKQQQKHIPQMQMQDEGDKQNRQNHVRATPKFRLFAFSQQILQFKSYISKYQKTVVLFRKVDNELLELSNQGTSPLITQLKKQRESLNLLMSDLQHAICHPKIGEMAKSFIQGCQIVNRE